MLDQKRKDEIDKMDYESMLRAWRFAPLGASAFQGEAGDYFGQVMTEKRAKIGSAEHTRISKKIGWDG